MDKRRIPVVLIVLLVLISSITYANTKIGSKIYDVLSTDIITEMNGQEVESFNINGLTAIYVNEVEKLGYAAKWDSDNRLVRVINNESMTPSYNEKKLTSSTNHRPIGTKINDVLYTDIKTKVNGSAIESFNINGSTAIFVSDLKKIPETTVTWKPDQRRVIISNVATKGSQKTTTEKINGLKLIDKKGILFSPTTEEPFTGTATWYYDNGQLSSKASFKDGKLHGEGRYYYKTGVLRKKGTYQKGHSHGESIWYHDNGQIKAKINFKAGEIHGGAVYYFPNGDIIKNLNFKEGNYHGELVYYYKNGQINRKLRYENGELSGESIWYSEDGKVINRQSF